MAIQGTHDPIRAQIKLYVKKDDDLVEHLLIVGFSSFTPNPLNLAVMAPSSEGKTWAITHVLELFPNAHFFTGATPKAFFYEVGELVDKDGKKFQERVDDLHTTVQDKDTPKKEKLAAKGELRRLWEGAMTRVNLEGRLLIFLDAPDHGLWNALKPLLSHDLMESIYSTVDKSGSGTQRTKKILLHGWPSCVFASARDEDQWVMWPEIRTRFGVVSPSADKSKYLEANKLTSRLFGSPSFLLKKDFPENMEKAAKDEVRRIKQGMEAFRLLGHSEGGGSTRDNFTFNPFTAWLDEHFPADAGSRMRAFRNLHAYINILAFMSLDQRPQVIVEGHPRAVVIAWEDVVASLRLVLGSFSSAIPAYKVEFWRDFVVAAYEAKAKGNLLAKKDSKLVPEDSDYKPLTISEIVDFANDRGNRIGPNRVRETFLKSLIEVDLVKEEPDPDNKRQNLYTPRLASIKLIAQLTDSANPSMIDPQIPLKALEELKLNARASIINYRISSDGGFILASNLQEVVDRLLPRSSVNSERTQTEGQNGEGDLEINRLGRPGNPSGERESSP